MPYTDPVKQREAQARWVARRRADFFAGKDCKWCHATERLELHHLDVSRKEHHAIWSWREERRLIEIAKCIVLCRPCHQKAHGQARRLEAELRHPHGTRQRHDLGCYCDPCRTAKREYNRLHPPKKPVAAAALSVRGEA